MVTLYLPVQMVVLQIGESDSPISSGRTLIIKVDADGTLEWKQESELFIRGRYNLGNSALEVADGYIILEVNKPIPAAHRKIV